MFKAEEESYNRRSTTARLYIDVKPVDINPPVIHSSAADEGYGFVEENSPIGTKVLDRNGQPIVLTVTDDDLVSITIPMIKPHMPDARIRRLLQ